MKLKTYLRGLGIGIIVTTIVMGITLGGGKEKLSDAEIIARAKELGMVESTVAQPDENDEKEPEKSADKPEPESKTGQEDMPEVKDNDKEGQSRRETDEPESVKESEPEVPDMAAAENNAPSHENVIVVAGEVVNVSIVNGDDSATVSRRLEELNLIISASQFDQFLCDNGYAKKLSPGNYEIAIGSSEETIAKIITKSR